ncbi:MAG: protein kinase [Anaerolineales bacterium]|nr:protein kinase [Anaerolineales bacterium]
MTISSTPTSDLIEAYRLIRAGKRQAALEILKLLLERHPRSERAWLLFSYAVLDPNIQRDCLQRVLDINPNNAEARRRLEELNAQSSAPESAQPVEPPRPSPALPAWLVTKTAPIVERDDAPPESSAQASPTDVPETPTAREAQSPSAPTSQSAWVEVEPGTLTSAPEPDQTAGMSAEPTAAEAAGVFAEVVTPTGVPELERDADAGSEAGEVGAKPVVAKIEPSAVLESDPLGSPAAESPPPGRDLSESSEAAAAPQVKPQSTPPTHLRPGRVEEQPPARRRAAIGLLPNTLVRGRYRVMGEIAAGASGAVYRAYDETEGRDVALKFIPEPTPAMEREFRREAELLLPLRHPHLPRFRDYFIFPGQGLYLVMDFIRGDSTEALLEREGPLPESDVLHWTLRLLDALHYLHSQVPPLVHADVKPANIRLTLEGRIVLVDYGLGRTPTAWADADRRPYLPPEAKTDARSDLYMLGATCYTLLTGHLPETGQERLGGRVALTPLRQRRPDVSPQLAQAIERALSLQPQARFETAVEFAEALLEVESFAALAKAESDSPSRAWLAWLALGLVVLGLLAVFAVFLVTGPPEVRPTTTPPGPPTLAPIWATVTALQAAALSTPSATPTPLNSPTPTETVTPTPTPTIQATPIGGGASGRIAFVSERNGKPQIFLMNADGSNQTALTDLADGACQPAWSPDGKQLVFISPCARRAETYPGAALYRMNADGSDVQQLLTLAGGIFDPDWSPSGLTFTVLQGNRPQVYVAAADGSNPQRLSSPTAFDRHPTWSPDGARIVFLNNNRAGRPTLFWMNKDGTFEDGSNPRQVTRDLDADSPAWSPDGRLVAFVFQNRLFTVPWDGLGFGVRAVRGEGFNDEPAWSPDGQWLVFESWRAASERDIYRMPIAGGEVVQLTTDPAPDYYPAWQP